MQIYEIFSNKKEKPSEKTQKIICISLQIVIVCQLYVRYQRNGFLLPHPVHGLHHDILLAGGIVFCKALRPFIVHDEDPLLYCSITSIVFRAIYLERFHIAFQFVISISFLPFSCILAERLSTFLL